MTSELREKLAVDAGGVSVAGTATYAPRTVTVRIESPYADIDDSLYIPYFAARLYSFSSGDSITERGRERAEMLLIRLYHSCVLFDSHTKELQAEYDCMADHLLKETPAFDSDEYWNQRRQLRRSFRTKQITQRVFQRQLKTMKAMLRKREGLRFDIEYRLALHIQANHGLLIPFGTLEQLIRKFLKPRTLSDKVPPGGP